MPVYHFTIHAYRSWRPDNPRGYTLKGAGYQPPDTDLATEYDENAVQDVARFDALVQREILVLAHQIALCEGWCLEAAGFDPAHAHLVLSWRGFHRWEEVDRRLKNLLALKLNRRHETPGKRWFVRRHSAPRRVKDAAHFRHLLETYLPDHPGLVWTRGLPLPTIE